MERLTKPNWRDLSARDACCLSAPGCAHGFVPAVCDVCRVPRIYAALAAYEDTGLEPEQIDPNAIRPLKARVRRVKK